ncbi:MAG: ATP-binding protein [Ideonella sp.]|jgi:signal transduction histidine kinase|nr:ATP-binding protein [Ideonella sp.]
MTPGPGGYGPVPWWRSLRIRLLLATLVALLVALVLAGLLLSGLFREHVTRQFAQSLTAQLDQVTTALRFDAEGHPRVDEATLVDPRWGRPYSGLYWQVDRVGPVVERGVRRSRSLWDTTLQPPDDTLTDGEVHRHEVPGPAGAQLLLVERAVTSAEAAPGPWRLMVAADLAETQVARDRFDGVLAGSLVALGMLLMGAAWVQVAVGLAPLRALQAALTRLQEGRAPRLEDPVPAEVRPLVDGFNRVLDRNDEVVARARTQAGNLAHAIKTPLAVLSQAAADARRPGADPAGLAAVVDEQIAVARRHVDWHLARARAAAARDRPGAQVAVHDVVAGLLRVMERVHADRELDLRAQGIDPSLHFAGEVQDLQEMVGNLVDNACKWARREVRVEARPVALASEGRLEIVVDDDGPGIDETHRSTALARGARLDESVPGTGLGLAIVNELAGLYGGQLRLAAAPQGGLRAVLSLPGG